MATGQRAEAEELRRLHAAPELLVLVNVWDVASARVVAGAPGCRAIATASWSIAAALGFRDGEQLSREDMLGGGGRGPHRRGRRPAGDRGPRDRLRRERRRGRPDDRRRDRGGRRRLQPRGR